MAAPILARFACLAFLAPLAAANAQAPAAAPVMTAERNSCPDDSGAVALGSAQWNGWGRDLDNTRYQPEPALRASDVGRLALKWAYGYQAGSEFGQPSIIDGRVFVTSSAGRLYALDAKTGCTYWTYDAPAALRGAAVVGELARGRIVALPRKIKRTLAHLEVIKAPSAVYVGGDLGMVYALDAQRGTLLWKVQVDAHPLARIIGAPVVYAERLYVAVSSTEAEAASTPGYACCTFRGSVAAVELASGRLLWKSYTVLEEPVPTHRSAAGVQEFGPAGAPINAAPTIDVERKTLYVTTGGSPTGAEQSLTDAVVAFGLDDGRLRWVKQLSRPDHAAGTAGFLSPVVLRSLANGAQVLIAGQKSGIVYALDPAHGGAVLWQTKLPAIAPEAAASVAPTGGIGWGSAADHRNLYVALSGSLGQPENASGSLSALDLKSGSARWFTPAPAPSCAWRDRPCSHAQSQAVSVMPGSVLSGALDGHLRAYSTIDGKILWDFDTGREFDTRNGVKASGGPLDRGGATVVNGIVYLNSGNALLAFSIEGK